MQHTSKQATCTACTSGHRSRRVQAARTCPLSRGRQRPSSRHLQLAYALVRGKSSAVEHRDAAQNPVQRTPVQHLERSLEAGTFHENSSVDESTSQCQETGASAERALVEESASRTHAEPASASGASKRVLDQTEVFHSTWQHRAWVWGATALLSATFLRGCTKVHDPMAASVAVAAAVLAYYVAGTPCLITCLLSIL